MTYLLRLVIALSDDFIVRTDLYILIIVVCNHTSYDFTYEPISSSSSVINEVVFFMVKLKPLINVISDCLFWQLAGR